MLPHDIQEQEQSHDDLEPYEWQDSDEQDYYSSEEYKEFTVAHDARMLEELDRATERLMDGYDSLTNDERYLRIADFLDVRRGQTYEHANGGNADDGAARAFNTLQKLQEGTDSHYTKRLLEWGMLFEAHTVADNMMWGDEWTESVIEVDREASVFAPRQPFPLWNEEYAEGGHVVHKITDTGKQYLAEHPEYKGITEFVAQKTTEYPWLGDPDMYPPSPYASIYHKGAYRGDDIRARRKAEIDSLHVWPEDLSELPAYRSVVEDYPNPAEYELDVETLHLFGLNKIEDISEQARARLYHVGVNLTDKEYDRLLAITQKMPDSLKLSFAEAFLATEFGSDLADSVRTIAEKAAPEIAQEVFDTLGKCREYATSFGDMFKSYDPDFAASASRAIIERLTDGIATIEALVQRRHIRVDMGVGGTYAEDLEEGMKALRLAEESMRIRHEVMTDPNMIAGRAVEWNGQFAMYRFTSEKHGEVLLYIRPEGAKDYDRDFEYGTKRGVEGSISFITNPVGSHHLRVDKDPSGVSFRFDREGRAVGESHSSEHRDPTREDGIVSVDVSSVLGNVASPAARVGRFFAAGNVLRSRKTGAAAALHHNTNFFDQATYGSAKGFKGLAEYTMAMAEAAVHTRSRRHAGKLALGKK